MKVLLIKMSSMGDVIHTLPAVTEAAEHFPEIEFDWVVEKGFAEIPRMHPAVRNIFPIALRFWKKNLSESSTYASAKQFIQQLQSKQYDFVIDAQGLLKSAMVTKFTRGELHGYDKVSIREPLASFFYQVKHTVSRELHAVERIRQLFSKSLSYSLGDKKPDYGLSLPKNKMVLLSEVSKPYVMFLHGTTWETKEWPVMYWHDLARRIIDSGKQVLMPWGNAQEQQRAKQLEKQLGSSLVVLPKLGLLELATIISRASAAVAVDSGLGHMAAALRVPTISIYGPTDTRLTGTYGKKQFHLSSSMECAPCLSKECSFSGPAVCYPACFGENNPDKVWQQLLELCSKEAIDDSADE